MNKESNQGEGRMRKAIKAAIENSNRYAKVHTLFRLLALENKAKNISVAAIKTKQFWKDFFKIDSLTDLSDKELKDLEDFIEKRIHYYYDHNKRKS